MEPRPSRTRAVPRIRGWLLAAGAALLLLPASTSSLPAAADTVVVVVSADSPLLELSGEHLADIYLGRTSRFPDGRRATPIDLEPGSPERREFYETYLGRSPAEIKSHWSRLIFTGRGRPPPDVPSVERAKERIASDPAAIGYVDDSVVDESIRVVRIRS